MTKLRARGGGVLAAGVTVAFLGVAANPAWASDPSGANGTLKIEADDWGSPVAPDPDGTPENVPHVTCDFDLELYGFDAGQTGDVVFELWNPTTGQTEGELRKDSDVLISDDAAGGAGNDLDEVYPYATEDDFDFSGVEAHPKQGYHVKVWLDTEGPGKGKYKVFWVEPCEATAPEDTPSEEPTSEATPSEEPASEVNPSEEPASDENVSEDVPAEDVAAEEVPADLETEETGALAETGGGGLLTTALVGLVLAGGGFGLMQFARHRKAAAATAATAGTTPDQPES